MSETIKVSKETKQSLIKIGARLQANSGKMVDLDENIQYLISLGEKKPDLPDKVFGSVPKLRISDLNEERSSDERRAKRKYRV
jgi:hypothetical protein